MIGIVRLAWAALLLTDSGDALTAGEQRRDGDARVVARVLGARHLAQGVVELATWPRWRRAGVAVDAAHAVTAVGFAAVGVRWRRVAIADSLIAATFAAIGHR